jgi:hypothetical protein
LAIRLSNRGCFGPRHVSVMERWLWLPVDIGDGESIGVSDDERAVACFNLPGIGEFAGVRLAKVWKLAPLGAYCRVLRGTPITFGLFAVRKHE